MAFDANKHMIRVQGNKEYLPVSARLIWFRQEHPDWSIITAPVEINIELQYAIFSATISNAEGRIIATGTKMENVQGFPDYIEKAETSAVGRALAMTGFGTQFAPEMDECDRLADSPRATNTPRTGSRFGTSRGIRSPQSRPPDDRETPFLDGEASANHSGNHCCVDGCVGVLTPSQLTMSRQKYGRALCLTHQKDPALTGRTPVRSEGVL